MYVVGREVSLEFYILTKCKEKCRRVVFSKLMYGLVSNMREKISNCLINREMLETAICSSGINSS